MLCYSVGWGAPTFGENAEECSVNLATSGNSPLLNLHGVS